MIEGFNEFSFLKPYILWFGSGMADWLYKCIKYTHTYLLMRGTSECQMWQFLLLFCLLTLMIWWNYVAFANWVEDVRVVQQYQEL